MSRSEQILKTIKGLATTTPDVQASAVVDNDGLMIASALPQDADEDTVAAMSAALLGLSERIASELGRGDLEMVMVRGNDGYSIISRCGPDAVLSILTSSNAKLGLVFLDTKRVAKEVARLLT